VKLHEPALNGWSAGSPIKASLLPQFLPSPPTGLVREAPRRNLMPVWSRGCFRLPLVVLMNHALTAPQEQKMELSPPEHQSTPTVNGGNSVVAGWAGTEESKVVAQLAGQF
jgi:hypothetical protein